MHSAAGRLATALALATFALVVPAARAADPYMVKDVNNVPVPRGSLRSGSAMLTIGSTTYFSASVTPNANDFAAERQLWKTDGTEAGTTRVGSVLLDDEAFGVALGGRLFFSGCIASGDDCQPWISDGTDAGTQPVANLYAGGSFPQQFATAGNAVYFSALTDSGRELWRSDGTAAGTQLVVDLNPGPGSSTPNVVGAIGSALVFTASDGTNRNLYATDGTAAGTVTLMPLSSGMIVTGVPVNGAVLFTVSNPSAGAATQLWRTDGTVGGTGKVLDNPAAISLSGAWIKGSTAYLIVTGTTRSELWRSDGTAAGTQFVHDFAPAPPSVSSLALIGDQICFFTNMTSTWVWPQLWKTDGTVAGTVLLKAGNWFSDGFAISNGNEVVFGMSKSSIDPAPCMDMDMELWRTDGTVAGTTLVAMVGSGLFAGGVRQNSFVFSGCDNRYGSEPWITDGTSAGTHLLKNIEPENSTYEGTPYKLVAFDRRVIFQAFTIAGEPDLWISDGTGEGTIAIAPQTTVAGESRPVCSGNLCFYIRHVFTGAQRYELWRTDGTPDGTFRLLKSVRLDGSEAIRQLTRFRGGVFFSAFEADHGFEPWFSDGTVEGTAMITDLVAGPADSVAAISEATESAAKLYFSASTGTNGVKELWSTDGTAAGTSRVVFRSPNGVSTSQRRLTDVRGTLYFESVSYPWTELWRTDGTSAGSKMLMSVHDMGPIDAIFNLNGKVLFLLAEKWVVPDTRQLWISDGTEAGTALVMTGVPAVTGPSVVRGNELLWTIRNAQRHGELWRTDGTAAGTYMVYRMAGSGAELVSAGGLLYLCDWKTVTVSDGTEAGTHALFGNDLFSGPRYPGYLVQAGPTLFFAATDSLHGAELWAYPLPFVHGDANGDGAVTVADLFYLLNNIFSGGPAPLGSGDANGDGQVNAADVFYLLNHFFLGGPGPK